MGNICSQRDQKSYILEEGHPVNPRQQLEEKIQSEDEQLEEEPVFLTLIICNGDYNPDLFSLDIITFDKLEGSTADKNNVLEFLNDSVYQPNKNPENLYIVIDSNKEELDATI